MAYIEMPTNMMVLVVKGMGGCKKLGPLFCVCAPVMRIIVYWGLY